MANGQNAKGTGPVSLSAALAVADYDLAAASEDFAMAVETAALADAFDALDGLKEQDITDAQNLVSEIDVDGNGISEEERKAALAAICNGP